MACGTQAGRRLVGGALEQVIANSLPGARVTVIVRALKGAVLLRVVSDEARASLELDASSLPNRAELVTLLAAAEAAGGTLLAQRRGAGIEISIRLAPAGLMEEHRVVMGRKGER